MVLQPIYKLNTQLLTWTADFYIEKKKNKGTTHALCCSLYNDYIAVLILSIRLPSAQHESLKHGNTASNYDSLWEAASDLPYSRFSVA